MATIVITCKSCGSRFKLDSDKLDKPRNKVRCSQCRSVFLVDQPEENELVHIEISEEESGFFPETDSKEEEEEAAEAAVEEQEEFLFPENKSPQAGSSGKKLLIGVIAAVPLILIAALIFVSGGRIFKAEKAPIVAVKPIVNIADSVDAFYLENMHSGEVLVIKGKVVNNSSKPVSFVMIEGKLFNRKDSVVLTQRCYAGNPITRSDITHLKLSEIEGKMMNREGQNLKDVQIPPSGEAPFLLVFHDLPEISTLSNYSVNVVSSELN